MDALVARIVAAGLTSAVFTYFMVQLVVKPALLRCGDTWWHALATNGLSLLIAVLTAFGLTYLMVETFTGRVAVEAVFVGVIAAATATFGHEAVKNFGKRNTINVGNIEESEGVVIGNESSADIDSV